MPILQPLAALAAWTMVMWLWMYATRIPAMNKLAIEPDALVQANAPRLEEILPRQVTWKADNYNHLHEAPTVFYAVVLALAVMDKGAGAALFLAWLYVLLRIVHSLVQATVNKVLLRFGVFAMSSAVLLGLVLLTLRAAFA